MARIGRYGGLTSKESKESGPGRGPGPVPGAWTWTWAGTETGGLGVDLGRGIRDGPERVFA
jgi:hypothetical protein